MTLLSHDCPLVACLFYWLSSAWITGLITVLRLKLLSHDCPLVAFLFFQAVLPLLLETVLRLTLLSYGCPVVAVPVFYSCWSSAWVTGLKTVLRLTLLSHNCSLIFLAIFWWVRVCWTLLCLCRPFCIFERSLHSDPESCCRDRLATNLATHLLTYSRPYPFTWLPAFLPGYPLLGLLVLRLSSHDCPLLDLSYSSLLTCLMTVLGLTFTHFSLITIFSSWLSYE